MSDAAKHLHLDAIGGIAGDMFLASALHAAPELLDEVEAVAARIGPGVQVSLETAKDHGLAGRRLNLSLPGKDRGPRHYGDYLKVLGEVAPDRGVAARACDILERLGKAEASVHGVDLNAVHFHEISDWDSIADILLSALVLERLNISSASIGPIPIGSGRIETEHGILPVPAPATLELLRGFTLTDDGVPGERVTPTGAAILSHLAPQRGLPGCWELRSIGCGFGRRSFEGMANLLRVCIYAGEDALPGDRIGVISFHIDDQTPEDLATGLANVRALNGVLDVLQYSALGKKGRLTTCIEVFCVPERLGEVAAACFLQTTTIGMRTRQENRILLRREMQGISLDGERFEIKQSRRPSGAVLVKPEADDIEKAGDHTARELLRRRIANSLDMKMPKAKERN